MHGMTFNRSIVTENEPLDTWDEEETILTPDGDDEVNKYCRHIKVNAVEISLLCGTI